MLWTSMHFQVWSILNKMLFLYDHRSAVEFHVLCEWPEQTHTKTLILWLPNDQDGQLAGTVERGEPEMMGPRPHTGYHY